MECGVYQGVQTLQMSQYRDTDNNLQAASCQRVRRFHETHSRADNGRGPAFYHRVPVICEVQQHRRRTVNCYPRSSH